MNRVDHSEECSKSELDLFSVPPTQVAVEEGIWDDIKPHPNFKTGTVTFDITGDSTNYISLADTELWLKVKMQVKKENEWKPMDWTTKPNIGPVNNLIHSLFSQCQVYLNNKEVENTNANYAYKAYLNNLLCHGKESKETFLENEMFIKDEAGQMDKFEMYGGTTTNRVAEVDIKKFNSGLLARHNIFKDNDLVQLKGRLHCDIFNTNRYLLSNVNVSVKLTRNKSEFYLIGNGEYQIIIEDTFLRIRRVRIAPHIALSHAKMLESLNAKYPIKRVTLKQFSLPYMSSKCSISNISTGILPQRVVIGFLDTSAYDGSLELNPYNFQHFNVQKLTLKVASKALPYSSGLELDYQNNCYMQGYNTLYQGIRESGNALTYKDYKNGYTLYAFDLSPDLCNDQHLNLFKDGSLDLDIDLKEGHKSAVTVLFYLEYDNIIEITKQRNVLVDYQV
jgi:hypothetical protein